VPVYPIPIRAPTGCYPRLVVLTRNARTLVPGAKRRRRRNVETYRKTAVSRSLVRQRWLPLALSGVTNPTALVEHLLVRSAGVEPAATWPSTKPVFLFAARAHGAATRCRPGSPAVRKRGRSRARRRSWPSSPRTRKLRVQSPADLPILPMAIKCGRRDSNGQAARFELARSAGCLHSRMVRRQGLEPRPRHRLRACRSTIELAAHGAVPGSRTPMICLEGKCLAVRPVRHGGSRRNRTCLRRDSAGC
jgi:hypothetical protein